MHNSARESGYRWETDLTPEERAAPPALPHAHIPTVREVCGVTALALLLGTAGAFALPPEHSAMTMWGMLHLWHGDAASLGTLLPGLWSLAFVYAALWPPSVLAAYLVAFVPSVARRPYYERAGISLALVAAWVIAFRVYARFAIGY